MAERPDRQMAVMTKEIQTVGEFRRIDVAVVLQPVQDQAHRAGEDELINEL